ncbi:MAG: LysR substrate-binding domain-containing protein [Paracoccaceae bacterium]
MKHTQLRAFQNVALHGGFSLAARAIGLTQSAVSDQVLSLEREFDILLFDRSKKQTRLTNQGKQLFAITSQLFEIESQALDFLTESRSVATGTLNIIADSASHVTELLSRFRLKHPAVRINLRSGNTAEVEQALIAYHADIGVLGTTMHPERYQSVILGSSPIIAFAAAGFAKFNKRPQTLTQLSRHPLVLRERGSKTRQKLEEMAKKQRLTLTPAIEAEGREAVREIVAKGGGIGFVSRAEFGQDQRLKPIPIAGPEMIMQETVVCIRQRSDVRTIRSFMEMAASAPG